MRLNKKTKMVTCEDVNCPFHGKLSTRGLILEGVVASDKMDKTVVVQRDRFVKSRKYERYMSKRSRILAHNPPCIDARKGEKVRIAECRKLSKNKSFVVIKKLEEEKKRDNLKNGQTVRVK